MDPIRILCLEDCVFDREQLASTLAAGGLQARFTWISARRAFEDAVRRGDQDLILADFLLPGYSGADALDFARTHAPDLPLVFVSGAIGPERAVEIMKSGATDCVAKERLDRLVPVITRALAEARERRDRRRAEESLRVSEEQFASIFSHSAIGMALFTLQGRWFRVNPALCRMLGYSEEELLQRSFEDVTHPSDLAENQEHLRLILAGVQDAYQLESRYLHKSGRILWGILTVSLVRTRAGAPRHLISQVQDLTTRRQAEERLREIEERYRAVFERSLDAVYLHDLHGRFIDANTNALKLLGYEKEHVSTLSFASLIEEPDHLARAHEGIQRLMETGTQPGHSEFRIKRRDGSFVWVEILSSLIYKDGTPVAVQGIARDITARKRAEAALRASEHRYRTILENEPECVKMVSIEGARLLELNPAGLRMIEASRSEEALGRSLLDFVHEEDREAAAAAHARVCSGESCQAEFRLVGLRGTVRWMECHSVPLRTEEGTIVSILSVTRDITGRRESELERQRLLYDLHQRVKELRGLREVADILRQDSLPRADLLHKIAHLLVETMQFPEITAVRVAFAADEQATGNFRPTPWMIEREFTAHEEDGRGCVQIAYLEEKPLAGEGPFLPEERDMLDSLSEMLRAYFEKKRAVDALRESNERFELQHAALTALTRSRVFHTQDLGAALREITETVASTLGVERVSIWRLRDRAIFCEDLFEAAEARHSSGMTLAEEINPAYFEALRQSDVIDADDAVADPRTAGFTPSYLRPLGIGAMLNVPVHLRSELARVLCAERVGPARRWTHDERSFAVSIANLISLTLAQWQSRQAEAKLEEQASLLNHARDAILVRTLDHRVTYWNRGAERTYGWTAEEAIGRFVTELIYHNSAAFKKAVAHLMEKGEWSGELEQAHKDGRTVLIEGRWTLMRDAAGRPRSVLCINTDVGEKKKLEMQFLRAQRMESIGTLAGGIAHDLNNVLAPIMMSIEILKEEVRSGAGREMLDLLQSSAERGAGLVKQVLAFARGIEGQRAALDPVSLLREIERALQNSFPKSIRISFSAPARVSTVLGDATQLHQVLLNLCVNARDAMPTGGDLALAIENLTLDELYSELNLAVKPGAYVLISVSDTGAGIPPEIRDQIFDPFFTTKEIGKGTGLGLSTSLAIVKSHGGFVDVQSEPGRGSIFKVFLPANTSPAAASESSAPAPELPRGKGELILVVDDEENVRAIVRKTLERFGYQVVLASHGAEAVAIYAQQGPRIAAVITDMAMPVMDGLALIFALKAINPHIRIMAFSGHAYDGNVAKALEAGIQHFIAKPHTAETLLQTLAGVLRPPAP